MNSISLFRMVKRKVALAFADTSSHGNSDDNKTTARRSRRTGNTQKRIDPSNVTNSDSDDDIDFVGEMPMGRSSAATAVKAERSQRHQQCHEAQNQNRQGAEQRHEDDLRQREEEELKRAIELSKLDMEVEKSQSESQDEWITLEPQRRFNENQSSQLKRKSLSSRGSRAADGPSEWHEDKPQSSSSSHSTPLEMEPTSQEHYNEWQDAMESPEWDDPSQQKGVDNRDHSSPSFCMKRTDSIEKRRGKINSSQPETNRHQYAEEIVGHLTKESPQEPRSRLRLRKRTFQGEVSSQHSHPSKTRKVPSAQDADESEDDKGDEQSLEEIDMTKDEEVSSGEEETEEERRDLEIIPLVDTRKPRHPKHPYYAPLNSSKCTYTKVVYKLIQAYCSRLRRAQSKALTKVVMGNPVATGNCFRDTLVFRKRGSRGFTYYTLSDSDEEDIAVADNHIKAGPSDTPVKTRLVRRTTKFDLTDDDSDSDFIPVRRNKLSTKGRQKLSASDVVEMLKTKSQHLQEREEDVIIPDDNEAFFQTLGQDQSQTQDYCPDDSDRRQPTIRTAHKSQLTPSYAIGRSFSPHCVAGADSQNSITDIFKVSTNDDETDEQEASESPTKKTDGKKQRPTLGGDSETDSFDERLLAQSSLNNSALSKKAVTPTFTNHSQSSNRAISNQELLSPENSKMRSLQDTDKDAFSEKSVISSGPADSSQQCQPSQENTRTESRDKEVEVDEYDSLGLSFEEKRLIYYGEMFPSTEPDEMKQSSWEERLDKEVQEMSQSRVKKNMQSATPGKLETQQQKHTSRATSSGGSQPPEGASSTINLSAFRPQRASVESTTQKVGRSKTERFNDHEERVDDWDGEEADGDCSEEERVQGKDVAEVGEGEEDAGDGDADSDVTCMDENEHVEDEIGEPPQDDDQIDQTEDGEEELDEDGDEEVVSEGGDVVVTVEDEVEEVGVDCPLCGVQFPLDRIEAHASECNGPVSPPPPPKENNRQEEDDVDSQEVPMRGRRAQHHPIRKGLLGSLNDINANGDDVPGPSTAVQPKSRSQVRNTAEGERPLRGIATKIMKKNTSGSMSSKQDPISSKWSPNEKRLTPNWDEDASDSHSESSDHLNATLIQLVQDHNLFQPKRTRVQERPTKRQRLQDGNKHEKTSSSVEETEPCFICNKRIPKSLYAKHVQDEIDKAEATELSQDAVQPRRGLRSKKATGVETSMDMEKLQSGPSNDVGDLIEDYESGDLGPLDSESDDSLSDPVLDPMVSESPIKAFQPISKQPMNLINFKNQFQNNASGSRKRRRSTTTSSSRGRGQGNRGGRKQRGKKRRRFPRKK